VNEAADYLRDLGIGGSAVGTASPSRGIPALMNSTEEITGSISASARIASS
jgi:hypothetical protein